MRTVTIGELKMKLNEILEEDQKAVLLNTEDGRKIIAEVDNETGRVIFSIEDYAYSKEFIKMTGVPVEVMFSEGWKVYVDFELPVSVNPQEWADSFIRFSNNKSGNISNSDMLVWFDSAMSAARSISMLQHSWSK